MIPPRLADPQIVHGWQILDYPPYGVYRAEDYEPELRTPCVKYVLWADDTGAFVLIPSTREQLHEALRLHYQAARERRELFVELEQPARGNA
jgi:hypothetical protein